MFLAIPSDTPQTTVPCNPKSPGTVLIDSSFLMRYNTAIHINRRREHAMPRQARKLSEFGYMHLIIRGIGKQIMFEEEADYERFLSVLERVCGETEVRLCAYCLMGNHVHLLVNDQKKSTPLFMKKLGISYAQYFNRKYRRNGHLLQDRYLSEPVEDDAYLLTVFRYILNNPKKAGICDARSYPWNSYAQYDLPSPFMDLSLIRSLLGEQAMYEAFIDAPNDDLCLECDRPEHDDSWALDVLRKSLGVDSGTALLSYDRKKRNDALRKLKTKGLTIRQIERLTGINRNIVQKA